MWLLGIELLTTEPFLQPTSTSFLKQILLLVSGILLQIHISELKNRPNTPNHKTVIIASKENPGEERVLARNDLCHFCHRDSVSYHRTRSIMYSKLQRFFIKGKN
uniref:Uncharacterized protein n=1 Tax=Mus musculus TaxID=10090 RepID=Q8BJP9_MOUSE|nr:RIKEN cDNA B430203M17 gene [Mus musculus]BAC38072.1 unnamed protein product [Mus musculus]